MAAKGNQSKRDARDIERAKRRAQAVNMRIAGATYDAIAAQLGYVDGGHCRKDIRSAISNIIPSEEREFLRKIEHARLNNLFLSAYQKALGGDWKAHAACSMHSKSLRELFGLDVAAKYELTGPDGAPLTLSGPAINIAIEATPSLARQLIREKFAQDDVSTALPAASEGEIGAPVLPAGARVEGD